MIKRIITKFLIASLIAFALISVHAIIYIIYLDRAGLSFKEIALVNLFYLLIIFLFGIPSKIMLNSFGKITSSIFSAILYGIGLIFYSLACNLLGFISAEIFIAAGTTIASGVLKAWLVDSASFRADEEDNIFLNRPAKIIYITKLITVFISLYLGIRSLSSHLTVVGLSYWFLTILFILVKKETVLRGMKTKRDFSFDIRITAKESIAYVWQDDLVFIIIGLTIIIALGFSFLPLIWDSHYYSFFIRNCFLLLGLSLLMITGAKRTTFLSHRSFYVWAENSLGSLAKK